LLSQQKYNYHSLGPEDMRFQKIADKIQWRLLHYEHEATCIIGKVGELKKGSFFGSWGREWEAGRWVGEVLLHALRRDRRH
jgi:hypothetical protein